jgi:hypothetical protein
VIRSILCSVLFVLALPAHAVDLGWLSGHWCNESGEELWLPERGGLLLGLSRSEYGGRTHFEFLRIETDAEGTRYVAQPGGRPPTVFSLSASEAHSAEFRNPEHDFPKRIRYWRNGDALGAAIDDGDGGKAMQFAWTRCAIE